MKKQIKGALLLVPALALSLLSGCSGGVYIVDVLTENIENGTEITYIYSDGSTKSFSVENGKDGEDGAVSVDELYEKWLSENDLEESAENYDAFLSEYLSFSANEDYSNTIQKTFCSAATVYCDYVTASRSTQFPWQSSIVYSTVVQSGSAFIWKIEEDYTYLVTNYHVVYCSGAATGITGGNLPMNIYCYLYGSIGTYNAAGTDPTYGYTVYDYGDYAVECEYVGGSITTDIAVVKAPTARLKEINSDIGEVTLADDYYAGQTVFTVGNPLGYGFSVTQGIVSVDDEYITLSIDGTSRSYRSIRTDTAIYSGNSGGGLFNLDGQLIGITNAGATSYESLNYAVPLEIVRGVVENILYYQDGNVYRLQSGFTFSVSDTKFVYDAALGYGKIRENVYIDTVAENSFAKSVGLKSGDLLKSLTVNGTTYEITRNFTVSDLLYTVRAGDSLQFAYERDGESLLSPEYTVAKSDLIVIR